MKNQQSFSSGLPWGACQGLLLGQELVLLLAKSGVGPGKGMFPDLEMGQQTSRIISVAELTTSATESFL